MNNKNISIPKNLFDSMIQTYQKWERFSNELEDFLMSSNDDFIKKMRKARQEHLGGKTKPLADLKKKYV